MMLDPFRKVGLIEVRKHWSKVKDIETKMEKQTH